MYYEVIVFFDFDGRQLGEPKTFRRCSRGEATALVSRLLKSGLEKHMFEVWRRD